MRIFDINTEEEIMPSSMSRVTMTERVLDEANKGNKVISNILFNKSYSRGYLDLVDNGKKIIFNNCKFNYIDFTISNVEFNNCIFTRCNFIALSNVKLNNCDGTCSSIFGSNTHLLILGGTIEIINTRHFSIHPFNDDCSFVLKVKNSPDFLELEKAYTKFENQRKLDQLHQKSLINESLQGYKIIHVPYLVVLGFENDTRFVNLHKDKSRADKAIVKDLIPLTKDKDAIINYAFSDKLEYKIDHPVYPNDFDIFPGHDCGPGIHFCINPLDCRKHAGLNMTNNEYEELIHKNIHNNEKVQ